VLLLLRSFTRTTWVRWYQKGETSLDLTEAKDDGVLGWHSTNAFIIIIIINQLDHMQTVCTLLHMDNHINTSSVNSYKAKHCRQ